MVKISKYNIALKLRKNTYILYNTLYNSVSKIDSELMDAMLKRNLKDIPQDIKSKLYNFGFLVDDELEELNIIKTLRNFEISKLYSAFRVGLTLTMTYACNLKCPYCYEGSLTQKTDYLSKKDIDVILKFALNHQKYFPIKRNPSIDVSFYGGEPLLNWKCCKYTLESLEALKRKGEIEDYTAGFVTNGTLINMDVIDAINDFNIVSMQITLDGPKEIHDKRRITRTGKGTFDTIIHNIKLLLDNVTNKKFHIGIRINVDKTNVHAIPDLLDYLVSEGMSEVSISFGIIRGDIQHSHSCNNTLLTGSELRDYLPKLWKEAYVRGFEVQTRPNYKILYCMYDYLFSYVVDPNRKLYPCWEFVGNEKYSVGEITDDGHFKVKPYYYDVKAKDPTEFEECKKCPFLPICGGGCAAESIRRNGHPNGPGCDMNRYIWREGLKFYLARRYPHLFTSDELVDILGKVPEEVKDDTKTFEFKVGVGR